MMMEEISRVTEDYIKVIWAEGEWTGEPTTATRLAEHLGVARSTVSETIKRLTLEGLVEHAPYGAIALTAKGQTEALKVVRRHRLIETFLARHLGYTWDEVHDEAENLEHAVSDLMVERLDILLGRPTQDPHGDPIPAADGTLPPLDLVQLSALEKGTVGVVRRVSDRDPQILRYLESLGITLRTEVRVLEQLHFAGMISLDVRNTTLQIGIPVAQEVWVTSRG